MLAANANGQTKILVTTPQSVGLSSDFVGYLNAQKIKPDSFVAQLKRSIANGAKRVLVDFDTHVLGVEDNIIMKATTEPRSTTKTVKKKRLLSPKERTKVVKVNYTGINITDAEKLAFEAVRPEFNFDYILVVTSFEITNKGSGNIAFKPLKNFIINYEIYSADFKLVAGDKIEEKLSVSPTMMPAVLTNYVNLMADDVFRPAVTMLFNKKK